MYLCIHNIYTYIYTQYDMWGALARGDLTSMYWHYVLPQSTATHCNTPHHTATRCNTLHHTAPHCKTLYHTATHCKRTYRHDLLPPSLVTHCKTMRHTAQEYVASFLGCWLNNSICDPPHAACSRNTLLPYRDHANTQAHTYTHTRTHTHAHTRTPCLNRFKNRPLSLGESQ